LGTLTFRQPRLAALLLLKMIAAGASALLAIGRQKDLTITNAFASVTPVYPGAESARIESLVTAEIEEALREVPEVDVLSSVSAIDVSIIQLEMDETIDRAPIEGICSELRDKPSDDEAGFPAGVQPLDLNADKVNVCGAIVALTANHDGVPMTFVARCGDALGDRIRSVPDTEQVEIFGQPEEEVTVILDTSRAAGSWAHRAKRRNSDPTGKRQSAGRSGDRCGR
jgi:multidrug efflux pump subunit AcrB